MNNNDIKGCPICMRSLPSSTTSLQSIDLSEPLAGHLLETSCCKQSICKTCKEEWGKRSLRCPYCNETSQSQQDEEDDDEIIVVPIGMGSSVVAASQSTYVLSGFFPVCFTSVAVTAVSLCVYLLTNSH